MSVHNAHWMDIGVEDEWQNDYESPLPTFKDEYDPKVYDTERLAVFWGEPNDIVLLRKSPPPEWLEHLRRNDLGFSSIVALNCTTKQFSERHLDALHPHLLQRSCTLNPYISTVAGWGFASRINKTLESSHPQIARTMSNKATQRELLVRASIPTPRFEVFRSYVDLIHFLSADNSSSKYVLKQAFGASGKGMFVLDDASKVDYLLRRLNQGANSTGQKCLILEEWRPTIANLSYQLSLKGDGSISFDFVRQQTLSGGVFKGFRYQSDVEYKWQNRLETLGREVGIMLKSQGVRGVVNIDAIVDADGTVFPAIDINLRFSLASYFSNYVNRMPSARCLRVQYYDLPHSSVVRAIQTAEDLATNDVRTVAASVSDECVRKFRRFFMLYVAPSHDQIDELERRWLTGVR